MHYDLNQLADPRKFQRLVNAILIARFGEDARLTPIQGADGGSDGETAEGNPFFEFNCTTSPTEATHPLVEPPRPGRYIFQAKYHRTGDQRLSDLRSTVVNDFRTELTNNILKRTDRKNVNYFFLVTNLPASNEALKKIDDIRNELLGDRSNLHADVWWHERITTALDWAPDLWQAYPEIFPGGVAPILGLATTTKPEGFPRTFQLAVARQYDRDGQVKFRQIELEKRLLDLFVDLDATLVPDGEVVTGLQFRRLSSRAGVEAVFDSGVYRIHRKPDSALQLLLDDDLEVKRILLEGGPGQGKSTITQMAAQIYREKFLSTKESQKRDVSWHRLCRLRVPIRIELRDFAHWLSQDRDRSLDQYIARTISLDAGGASVSVEDVHQLIERSSVILMLDGLDEIGNDELRDRTIDSCMESVTRFEKGLRADIRVVLTTRPPAVVGRWNKLEGFARVLLTPMEGERIDEYLRRWLDAQIDTESERSRIEISFNSRRGESHVEALVRNPMQLSVLLQFIYLKGEAFPDRRAELYRDYFQIVIDRDVEKSPELRDHRELVEGLHSYLGFRLHGTAEVEQTKRALSRNEIIELSGQWLEQEGHSKQLAGTYFALGEERFGLIVALSGEGHETAYGFEVQPIQEYFAAAYISNRLTNGRAHDVFEALIYRDYWREVALFLAGLRRPNEKADLVARAKAADQDARSGRRQNGRGMMLQLLREGVMSQPRHVQTEAMQFAFGFLDEAELRWVPIPTAMIDTLAELAELYGGDETIGRVLEWAQESSERDDHGLISLSHRLASRVLPKDDYIKVVLGYQGEEEETRGLVRVTCPYDVTEVIKELGSTKSYWDGISAQVFARRFWSSVLRTGFVPNVKYPSDVHLSLVAEFCVGGGRGIRGAGDPVRLDGGTVPAILKLYHNLQLINYFMATKEAGLEASEESEAGEPPAEVCWEYGEPGSLPSEVEQCLRDLIDASEALLNHCSGGRAKEVRRSWRVYLRHIEQYIDEAGLVGWIAARCAGELLQAPPPSVRQLRSDGVVGNLFNEVRKFYPRGEGMFPGGRYYVEGLGVGVPRTIRMSQGGELRPLHEAISEVILQKRGAEGQKEWIWLRDLPVPSPFIRSVVDTCGEEMEAVLRFLGSHTAAVNERYYGGRRLRVQHTRRILKISRETRDPLVLRGAAVTLSCATFSRVAEPEVILKILSAAPWSRLVRQVFDTGESTRGRERSSRLDGLAREIAHNVLNEQRKHPFHLVNRAAAYLAEVEATRSKPLFEEWPDLLHSG